jgi:DNA-binding HxlR family transcriptional regulator
MVASKNPQPFSCGLDAALHLVGSKWKPYVLYHLSSRTLRYGELRRVIGPVSHKVLIQQLKQLEGDGIVKRVDYGEVPPRVEYSLTKFGQSLAQAFTGLCQWGTDNEREIARIVARRAG